MLTLIASGIMPRTTLDIDGTILEQLRRRASAERKSMGQVASEVLAPALATGAPAGAPAPLRWAAKRMGKPKIDLEDKEALWRLLDREQIEKGAS
jgi:hypothetical protein